MSKTVKIVAIVLSVAIVGVAGYFGYTGWSKMRKEIDTQKAEVTAKETKITELQEEVDTLSAQLSGVKEIVSSSESKEKTTPTPTSTATPKKSGVGYVKFKATYPSQGLPAFRICFSDIEDISKQYCFWKKASHDKRNYTNDLEGDTVELPAGRYHIDFAPYTDSTEIKGPQNVREIYAMKECVYYSESPAEPSNQCASWRDEISKTKSGYAPVQIVNYPQFGGLMFIFEVREGKTSTLKEFSLMPM